MALRCSRILITGGSRGIGLAIAQRLCREGAIVTVTAGHQENLDAAIKILPEHQAFGLLMDAANVEKMQEVIDTASVLMNGLDCLINCMGAAPVPELESGMGLFDMTPEIWDRIMNTNLRSTFFMMKSAAWYMLNHNQVFGSGEFRYIGDILNISADAPLVSGAFGLSKKGVNALTAGWAEWLNRFGIIVNGIARGIAIDPTGLQYDPEAQRLGGRTSLAEEIADTACFLLQETSKSIQGQIIFVSGKQGN